MPLKKVRIGSKAKAIYPIHYYIFFLNYMILYFVSEDGVINKNYNNKYIILLSVVYSYRTVEFMCCYALPKFQIV